MATLRERQANFQMRLCRLTLWAAERGTPIVWLEYYRTQERQQQLFNKGLSKTLKSKHIDGLACDVAYLQDLLDGKMDATADSAKPLGEWWEANGGRWGGRFGDNPATPQIEGWDAFHFEEP